MSSNKEEEKSHLERFLELYGGISGVEPEFADLTQKPDMLLRMPGRVIGIEHTRLYQPQITEGHIPQEQEQLRATIVHRAQELFDGERNISIDVQVNFNNPIGLSVDPKPFRLTKKQLSKKAEKISHFVSEHLPEEGQEVEYYRMQHVRVGDKYIHPYEDLIPRPVRSIWISRQKDAASSIWQSPEGGMVARFTQPLLQGAIDGKQAKIEDYKKRCDDAWLLMVASGFEPSTAFDIEASKPALDAEYVGDFEKVFLMVLFGAGLYELKIRPPKHGCLSFWK